MLRRIFQSISKIAKASKPTINFTPAENSDLMQNFYQKLQKSPTDKTNQALIDFKNSLKDLQTPSESSSSSSPSTITQNSSLFTENDISKLISTVDNMTPQELTNLANLYFEGAPNNTLQKDEHRAIELWKLASDQGNKEALYSLASCYFQGQGVARDPELAATYFLKLAETEFPYACYSLALMYVKGDGVPKDEIKAFQNFRLAAKGGITPALHMIGNCYAYGAGTTQSDYNAVLFYEAAVEAGDPMAMFTLATWTNIGRHVAKDPQRAYELNLKAANLGHPAAMFNIGCDYMSGKNVVKKDLVIAAEWFEKSAKKGFVHAALNVGKMYFEGTGVNRDLYKAREIFELFASRNTLCKQSLDAVNQELFADKETDAINSNNINMIDNNSASTVTVKNYVEKNT